MYIKFNLTVSPRCEPSECFVLWSQSPSSLDSRPSCPPSCTPSRTWGTSSSSPSLPLLCSPCWVYRYISGQTIHIFGDNATYAQVYMGVLSQKCVKNYPTEDDPEGLELWGNIRSISTRIVKRSPLARSHLKLLAMRTKKRKKNSLFFQRWKLGLFHAQRLQLVGRCGRWVRFTIDNHYFKTIC